MSKLLAEIRRRRVIQTFVPYLGFVWLILQIVSVITPALNWHPLVNTFFAIVLFAGIPVMLYLSWYFDFTTQGLEATPDLESGEVQPFGIIRWSFLLVITASSGLLGYQYYHDLKNEFSKSQEGIVKTIKADSIAVLPFHDSSPDQDQGFIAQGLAEEITSLLGRIQGLTVAASSSSAILKEKGLDPVTIARRLKVDTVLTGSVRKVGDKLTVRAELINAADGKVIWSESFARKFTDIFAVETEIARSTVNLLQDTYIESGTLTNSALTNSTDAYVVYLKGREQYRKQTTESMKEARTLFEQAIGLDPEYAQAYVALGNTIVLLSEGIERFGVLQVDIAARLAKEYIDKALTRQPELPEAYAVLGYISRLNSDPNFALNNFDKAIQLNPNLAEVFIWKYQLLSELGQLEESFEVAQIAYKLDPVSIATQYNLGFEFSRRGQIEKAKNIFEKLTNEFPNSPLGYAGLGDLNFSVGNYVQSLKYWKSAFELSPINKEYKDRYLGPLLQLGLSKQVRKLNAGPSYLATILLIEGKYLELFKEMEFQLAANPDDPWIKFEAGWYQILVGDKKVGIDYLLSAKKDLNKKDIFSMPWCSPAIEIAWALKQTDDIIESDKFSTICNKNILVERKNNIKQHELDYLTARLAALDNQPEEALKKLAVAIRNGWREWWTEKDPLFYELKDNPEFQKQIKIIEDDLILQKNEALKLFTE